MVSLRLLLDLCVVVVAVVESLIRILNVKKLRALKRSNDVWRNLHSSAAIDQLQLLRRLSDLEAQTAQQLETIAVLQSEIAGGVERHHGELSKLADMAADEIVPLAQKYERAQRKTRKFKQELSCVLCRSKKRSMIALPCAHLATCRKCMVGLTTCPICSVDVERWQLILLE